MKCVKNKKTGEITRVSNENAKQLVNVKATHVFVAKKEWKMAPNTTWVKAVPKEVEQN